MDALVNYAQKEGRDDEVVNALQGLARSDRSSYVRLKCASALRKLGSDGYLQADEK